MHHAWMAEARYSSRSEFLNWGVSYAYQRYVPTLGAAFVNYAVSYGDILLSLEPVGGNPLIKPIALRMNSASRATGAKNMPCLRAKRVRIKSRQVAVKIISVCKSLAQRLVERFDSYFADNSFFGAYRICRKSLWHLDRAENSTPAEIPWFRAGGCRFTSVRAGPSGYRAVPFIKWSLERDGRLNIGTILLRPSRSFAPFFSK